jgi:type I restriction enzyme M protein
MPPETKKRPSKKAADAPKTEKVKKTLSLSSLDDKVYEACDIMRRSNCSGAMNYVPELTWILFLRILDVMEQREAARSAVLGLAYEATLESPWRWSDWAAPFDEESSGGEGTIGERAPGWKRRELTEGEVNRFKEWVNAELIPHLKALRDGTSATPRQKVVSEILSGVERVRIDTDRNLLDVLDKVHQIHPDAVDDQHVFTLSQVYEGLLSDLGEKAGDGGQFFTPREIVRAAVQVVDPKIGETVYDPCCGTGGFLAQAYEHMTGDDHAKIRNARDLETLKQETFFGREKENLVYPVALANLVLHGIDYPHLWHGNSLTNDPIYDGLFQGAPANFDVILTNPPFGGKEGIDAQARFAFQTRATQVLFLQHIIDTLAPEGRCGIVLDEGILFRTTEEAFVRTKRKLLEECDLYCIVSLPGGAFSGTGAGVKTNLLFFNKGKATEKIWYYDLSDIKVGKKTPFTLDRFKEFFELLPERGDSDRSWTIDFIARREKAATDAAPFRKEVDRCEREIDALKTGRREKKKAGATDAELQKIDEQISELAKAAREATNRASAIEDAVYDLKAVNPTASGEVDNRTPGELIEIIEREGEVIRQALERLKGSFGSIIA